MNNNRLMGLALLVVVAMGGTAAVYLVYVMISQAETNRPTHRVEQKVEVVTAAGIISPGTTITSERLRKRELLAAYVPDDVYRTPEEVVGRVASERILVGEFIREERLAAREAGVGLAAIIPRGMRALQVPVRDGSAVSGFINPGNFVDVIAVCGQAEPPESRTLLQAVTVLAVNDRMVSHRTRDERDKARRNNRGAGVGASVTLALSPSDAELVKHAFGTCQITLTLRNDIDVTQITSNEPAPSASTTPSATETTTPAAGG